MITKKEIRAEASKRYPNKKPRNYLEDGMRLGFYKGALWMQNIKKQSNENTNHTIKDAGRFKASRKEAS